MTDWYYPFSGCGNCNGTACTVCWKRSPQQYWVSTSPQKEKITEIYEDGKLVKRIIEKE